MYLLIIYVKNHLPHVEIFYDRTDLYEFLMNYDSNDVESFEVKKCSIIEDDEIFIDLE